MELSFDIENEIMAIIEHNPISKFQELLHSYPNQWIMEVVLSSWITDQDKVLYIIKNYRGDLTDNWLMKVCVYDIETYILEAMHSQGIDLQAKYEDHHGNLVNFFTEICQVELGQNKSSYIISDNFFYLKSLDHVYIGEKGTQLNNYAKKYLNIE